MPLPTPKLIQGDSIHKSALMEILQPDPCCLANVQHCFMREGMQVEGAGPEVPQPMSCKITSLSLNFLI